MKRICYDLFDDEGGWVGCISAGSAAHAMRRGRSFKHMHDLVASAWRRK